jgi:hypothetical protein
MDDVVGSRDDRENTTRLDLTARKMLQLEARPFKYAGAKQEAIRSTLDMSSAEYHQRLNAVIDSEDALAYAPMVVRRLRRARSGRLPASGEVKTQTREGHA